MLRKIGLIGAGKWGSNFIKTIEAMPDVEIPIICTGRGLSVHGYKTTINISDVINAGVDGVIIATPPDSHYKIALKFLEAKIPVLLEKPISTNFSECHDLILAAKAYNTILRINYVHLYSSAFRELQREVVKWGNDPIRIVSAGGNTGPFRHYNSLQDYGPHDLSMIIKLLGRPFSYEIHEDIKTNGSIYRINMFYDSATTTSYVGNGFTSKYRKFTIHNIRTSQYVIYDDIGTHKFIVNGKPFEVDATSPLTNSVHDFVKILDNNSSWREELEISKHLSAILNSEIEQIR